MKPVFRIVSHASERVIAVIVLCVAAAGVAVAAETTQSRGGPSDEAGYVTVRDAALPPDQSAWSAVRQAAYRESLQAEFHEREGLLHIPAIGLTAPVLEGTSELVLNRGIGWIDGTARVGDAGNVGLAAHRDGYFRGLKDVRIGDAIELETAAGQLRYRIVDLMIVDPEDVFVLEPTEAPSVTLVTCFPFYFIGSAPHRYIVRAALDES